MMKPSNHPPPSLWMALFLSGLVLPGLGQIQIGQKKKGWLMVVLVLMTTVITFAKFMMGVLQVAERNRFQRPPTLQIWNTLKMAFEMEKSWILGGLLLILLVWILSLLDIVWASKKT